MTQRYEPPVPWTEVEVKTLRRLYSTHTYQEISEKLGRHIRAVKRKAAKLGLTVPRGRGVWSQEEIDLICKRYHTCTTHELTKELGRCTQAVQNKACELSLVQKHRSWTDQEVALLKKLLPTHSYKKIAARIDRPVYIVANKVHRLGISIRAKENPVVARRWTPIEDALLKRKHRKLSAKEIAKLLNRSKESIEGRVTALGLAVAHQKWQPKKVAFLKKHYGVKDNRWIAQRLNVTPETVGGKARSLGISVKRGPQKRWGEQEIAALKRCYPKMSLSQIVAKLNRSRDAVTAMAGKLGIRRKL